MNKLLEQIRFLPQESGIYQYYDANDKLIYIGKAKNLSKRVKNYFNFTPSLAPNKNLSKRLEKMVSSISSLEFIVADNEKDALILENSLIKQLKPKYNILLRDDKTFPYIYINLLDDFPRFAMTRRAIKKKGVKYFGPFTNSYKEILEALYDAFPLVQSASCLKGKKKCIYYQIKKCLAPCENLISSKEYRHFVDDAMIALNNKKILTQKIETKMQFYAEQNNFENAIKLRNAITNLKTSSLDSSIDFANESNIDIFVVENNAEKWIVMKVFMRAGKVISSDYQMSINSSDSSKEEFYKNGVINYYKNESLITPDFILFPEDIDCLDDINCFLEDVFDKKVPIDVPKIGEKKKLIDMVSKNAKIILDKKGNFCELDFLKKVQDVFKLNNIPYRIEAFDNSHHSQQARVGSMIVYENNAFKKTDYRQYKLEASYEYEQMKEMLSRRALSFHKNQAPDLWVIDGGKALLNLAKELIGNLNIDIIAIAKEKIDAKAHRAKGKAKDLIYINDEILKLSTSDKVLHFAQKLRDESHRFAIKNHRALKLKEDKHISLMNIKGIKEAKIKKLINYFGTFEAIKKASIDDISNILTKKDAENIVDYFTKK